MTNEAEQLLFAVAKDGTGKGTIQRFGSLEEMTIRAGGKDFLLPNTTQNTPETRARWEAAVEELEQSRLIKRRSGTSFSLTDKGFNAANTLSAS